MSAAPKMTDPRTLPAVSALLASAGGAELVERYGRSLTTEALRAVTAHARTRIQAGDGGDASADALLDAAAVWLYGELRTSLRPVINATGVILHTNLGRAPLSAEASAAAAAVATQYSTLEFDLSSGGRGSRLLHPEALLTRLTGAEAALVVNNCAAALLLLLAALAREREVIISRGQAVEIGGGFRIPDIMAESGARLVEVGTTNRTRTDDYARAITDRTALLMRVHASNFKQIGFVEDTPLADITRLAHEHGLLAVDDLGSGALIDTAAFGLAHEPTAHDSLAAGADVVSFSGDKLLGGPQAGILLGRREVIAALKRHPLARAVRADKMTLAALVATLLHYRRGEAVEKIPVLRMMVRPVASLRAQAEAWAGAVGGQVIDGTSTVGGGSLPGETLASALLALEVPGADAFAARLRAAEVPVIARIADGRVLLDPRTVLPGQDEALLQAVAAAHAG